jgi:hypothetical protein
MKSILTILEGADLYCPECQDNLGKASEYRANNGNKIYCGRCGYNSHPAPPAHKANSVPVKPIKEAKVTVDDAHGHLQMHGWQEMGGGGDHILYDHDKHPNHLINLDDNGEWAHVSYPSTEHRLDNRHQDVENTGKSAKSLVKHLNKFHAIKETYGDAKTSLKILRIYDKGNHQARVYKDTDFGEHRVKFYHKGDHLKNADYHTDDASDAHATAQAQLKTMAHPDAKGNFKESTIEIETMKSFSDFIAEDKTHARYIVHDHNGQQQGKVHNELNHAQSAAGSLETKSGRVHLVHKVEPHPDGGHHITASWEISPSNSHVKGYHWLKWSHNDAHPRKVQLKEGKHPLDNYKGSGDYEQDLTDLSKEVEEHEGHLKKMSLGATPLRELELKGLIKDKKAKIAAIRSALE